MNKLYVAGASLLTAIGGDPIMTGFANRAGISGIADTGIIAANGEPIKQCLIPNETLDALEGDPELTSYCNRLLKLCKYGIGQLIEESKLRTPVPLFLALPKWPEGRAVFHGAKQVYTKVIKQWADHIDPSNSRMVATGRTGGAHAMDLAFKYMASSGAELAMVGGVDSYNDIMLLCELEKQNRLNITGSFDGFVPGEASGFLLLASKSLKDRLKKNWCWVSQPYIAREEGHLYSEAALLGNGLSEAFCRALQHRPNGSKVSVIHASLTGEAYWAKELGIARLRNSAAFIEDADVRHIAENIGDVGAAYLPAVLAIRQAARSHNVALISVASDYEDRAAMLVGSEV